MQVLHMLHELCKRLALGKPREEAGRGKAGWICLLLKKRSVLADSDV